MIGNSYPVMTIVPVLTKRVSTVAIDRYNYAFAQLMTVKGTSGDDKEEIDYDERMLTRII